MLFTMSSAPVCRQSGPSILAGRTRHPPAGAPLLGYRGVRLGVSSGGQEKSDTQDIGLRVIYDSSQGESMMGAVLATDRDREERFPNLVGNPKYYPAWHVGDQKTLKEIKATTEGKLYFDPATRGIRRIAHEPQVVTRIAIWSHISWSNTIANYKRIGIILFTYYLVQL